MVNEVEVLVIEMEFSSAVFSASTGMLFFQQLMEDNLLEKCKHLIIRITGKLNGHKRADPMALVNTCGFNISEYKGKSCKCSGRLLAARYLTL